MQTADLEITDGVSVGDWIKPGLGGEFGAVSLQVREIYEAYARVFHPAYDREMKPVRWADADRDLGVGGFRSIARRHGLG